MTTSIAAKFSGDALRLGTFFMEFFLHFFTLHFYVFYIITLPVIMVPLERYCFILQCCRVIFYGFCINRNFVAGLVFYGGLQRELLALDATRPTWSRLVLKERACSVRSSCDDSDVVASNSKTFCIQR